MKKPKAIYQWRRNLHSGEGLCSRKLTIASIEYRGDSAWIMATDGWEIEVPLKELS